MDAMRNLIKIFSNIPGWCTDHKIVVFESDDWGSIRMPSKDIFEKLKARGIDESNNHYNLYDCLESNADLELLFELLASHKDKNGHSPVFTTANIVGNPNFDAIKRNGFTEYVFESFIDTLKRYHDHHRVAELWKEGINRKLVCPVFHGREHLNVNRWMKALQGKHLSTLTAFDVGVTGIYNGINGEAIPNYQAAFDIDYMSDIDRLKPIIESGLQLFENIFGYKTTYFVPANGKMNNSLEELLNVNGIRYLYSDKIQKEPIGNNKYIRNFRFTGMQNKYGQIYINRNSVFEPSSLEHPSHYDWIDNCLKDIEIAFKWHKPAIISTHRVNYMGYLYPENRSVGLSKLNELITKMLQKWPELEFLSSVEVGDLIKTNHSNQTT